MATSPDLSVADGPLLRALASSSTARRRAAMLQIATYLSSERRFTELDLQKIWKALFYCLYMTPKMRNQQHLAIQIAELTGAVRWGDGGRGAAALGGEEQGGAASAADTAVEDARPEGTRKRKRNVDGAGDGARKSRKTEQDKSEVVRRENFVLFLRTFWEAMIREWEGVDKVRLDKFLFLVRRMLAAGLEGCKVVAPQNTSDEAGSDEDEATEKDEGEAGYTWDAELVEATSQVLAAGPLQPKNQRVPGGLRLHVLDVMVDELDKADPHRSLEMDVLLEPVRVLSRDGLTKIMRKRAKETLADERVESWASGGGGDGDEAIPGTATAQAADGGSKDDDWDGFDD